MIDDYSTDASGDQADTAEESMIALERATAGIRNRLEQASRDAKRRGDTGNLSASAAAIADWAVNRQKGHIAAALRRAGIEIDEDERLTLAGLVGMISARAEIVLEDLTPEAVTDAVLRAASKHVSRELGFDVELSAETDWRQVAIDAAMQAVATGRANRIINGQVFGRLQFAAAAAGVGMSAADKRRMQNRMAQRRYRQRNRQVWYKKGELP